MLYTLCILNWHHYFCFYFQKQSYQCFSLILHVPILLHISKYSWYCIHIEFFWFYSYSTLNIHILSCPSCLVFFLSFQTKMIAIHVKPDRFSSSSTQSFYIIKTYLQHIVLILGSTGNTYLPSITLSHRLCNCPTNFNHASASYSLLQHVDSCHIESLICHFPIDLNFNNYMPPLPLQD